LYAGKAYAMVESRAKPQVISIRPNALGSKEIAGAGAVEKVAVTLDAAKIKAK